MFNSPARQAPDSSFSVTSSVPCFGPKEPGLPGTARCRKTRLGKFAAAWIARNCCAQDGRAPLRQLHGLGAFQGPARFTFVAELPKTATGKIQKHILRGGRPNIAPQ